MTVVQGGADVLTQQRAQGGPAKQVQAGKEGQGHRHQAGQEGQAGQGGKGRAVNNSPGIILEEKPLVTSGLLLFKN